jgi:hypothetical protein
MAENTVADLKTWLGTPEKPVTSKEMMDFWKSCSDEDKDHYRKAELS